MIPLSAGASPHPMPPFEAPRAPNTSRALTVASHAAFVPIGLVTVLLGPMLPVLSVRWSLNYAQAGRLFSVQLLASSLAVALSGVVVSRWGFRFAISAGLFAMAVGAAALPLSPYLLGLLCIASYGFGSGLAVPAANLAVAEANPHRRSAALSLLNFSWSLGAVACPFLVAIAAMAHRTQLFLMAVGGLMLMVAAGVAMIPTGGIESTAPPDGETRSPIAWGQRSFLIMGGLFFLYVGTEIAFGGWITTYARSLGSLPLSLTVVSPSFFYAALTVGRWVAPLILRSVGDIRLARAGLVTAGAGMVGMMWSHAAPGVVISAIVAGFGLSAVYPIAISLLSREFGAAASRVGSVMFTLANVGGACLPWLVGYFSKQFGNPRAGLAVPLISGMLMYVLYRATWNSPPEEESKS
jgi:FHS family glucose/mannose:H+ symporter-like MFS transporter